MVEYKRQHYVSKFYLRNFSEVSDNVYIYNIKKQEIFKIKITNLCQEKYFYSSDPKFEQTLSEIESEQAVILKKLINNLSVCSLNLKEQGYLNLFILMQYARTKGSGNRVNESLNAPYNRIVKPLLQEDPELNKKRITPKYIDSTTLIMEKAHRLAMGAALMGIESIVDLFPIFLINKTDFPFVTSDDPICLYNYVKLNKHPILGFQSPGLQIYCPLNQNIVFLLVDKHCYHIDLDEVRNDEGIVYVTEKSDVDAINKLQILNCNENVVFSSQKYEQYIKELYPQTYGQHIRDVHWEADTYFTKKPLCSKVSSNYYLNLSFVRLDHKKNKQLKGIIDRAKKTGTSIEICRNQEISRILKKKL